MKAMAPKGYGPESDTEVTGSYPVWPHLVGVVKFLIFFKSYGCIINKEAKMIFTFWGACAM